jgi:hypothetical protein
MSRDQRLGEGDQKEITLVFHGAKTVFRYKQKTDEQTKEDFVLEILFT